MTGAAPKAHRTPTHTCCVYLTGPEAAATAALGEATGLSRSALLRIGFELVKRLHPTEIVEAAGRLPDGRRGCGNGALGVRRTNYRDDLLRAIPAPPKHVTRADLDELVGGNTATWTDALATLIDEGLVSRVGAGVRGQPYHYSRCSATIAPQKGVPPAMNGRHAEPANEERASGQIRA